MPAFAGMTVAEERRFISLRVLTDGSDEALKRRRGTSLRRFGFASLALTPFSTRVYSAYLDRI